MTTSLRTKAFIGVAATVAFLICAGDALAQKPVCYATPDGNDANDGSYWSLAKADIMACYDALPLGGGTILVMDGGREHPVHACKANDPPGCGIWLMQYNDPNYASPPSGWRRAKPNIAIQGVGGGNGAGAFAHGGQVSVIAGGSDLDHPALWVDGASGMSISNLRFQATCFPAKLGLDSAGRAANAGIWNLYLANDYFFVSHVPGCGPGILIAGESAWDFIKDSQISANPAESARIAAISRSSGVVTVTTSASLPSSWRSGARIGVVGVGDSSFDGGEFSAAMVGPTSFTYSQKGPDARSAGGLVSSDQSQAILFDPQGGVGAGLIFFQDDFLVAGGIKVYRGANGAGIYAQNVLQEAGSSPVVWLVGCAPPTYATLDNLTSADAGGKFAAVRADCAKSSFDHIIVRNVDGVDGPATLLGGAGPKDRTQSPLLAGQSGIFNGYVMAQTNAARRGFGPVASRFPNLISRMEPFACSPPLTCTPADAPDGTHNATLIKSATRAGFDLYRGRQPVATGDIFIYAAWVRTLTPPGFFSNGNTPLNCSLVGVNTTDAWRAAAGSPQIANGEWDWAWGAFKVSYASAATGELVFGTNVGPTGIGVFAPVLIRVHSGTIADNEAIEYAETLQTFRHDAVPGQVSLLPGEQFKADSIQVGDGPTINSGIGAPIGSVPVGSIYLRRDGGPGATLFVYEKDGWKAVK